MADFDLKIIGLEKLQKALKGKLPVARVGILGNNAMRSDGGPNNAEIGAFHEFGTTKLPQRSFLRIPLTDNLGKALERSGAFDKKVLADVIAEGTLVPWIRLVAIAAEGVVLEAFDTAGFGKWRPSNMSGKTNAQTLVETGQLRGSITSEVKE